MKRFICFILAAAMLLSFGCSAKKEADEDIVIRNFLPKYELICDVFGLSDIKKAGYAEAYRTVGYIEDESYKYAGLYVAEDGTGIYELISHEGTELSKENLNKRTEIELTKEQTSEFLNKIKEYDLFGVVERPNFSIGDVTDPFIYVEALNSGRRLFADDLSLEDPEAVIALSTLLLEKGTELAE